MLLREFKRVTPRLLPLVHRAKLLLRQPDALTLNGVHLELHGWATEAIRRLIYNGWYEENERAVIEQTLRAEDVVLELGCGAGYITSVAAGIAREVRGFDANPEMVAVARATLSHNRGTAAVENAVIQREPTDAMVSFYLEPEFIASSLRPSATARRVEVPTRDFSRACEQCTYLIVDIEGAEVDLLRGTLPGIRAICVETHPEVTGLGPISEMLASLFGQGFVLDVELSRKSVLYLHRI